MNGPAHHSNDSPAEANTSLHALKLLLRYPGAHLQSRSRVALGRITTEGHLRKSRLGVEKIELRSSLKSSTNHNTYYLYRVICSGAPIGSWVVYTTMVIRQDIGNVVYSRFTVESVGKPAINIRPIYRIHKYINQVLFSMLLQIQRWLAHCLASFPPLPFLLLCVFDSGTPVLRLFIELPSFRFLLCTN